MKSQSPTKKQCTLQIMLKMKMIAINKYMSKLKSWSIEMPKATYSNSKS